MIATYAELSHILNSEMQALSHQFVGEIMNSHLIGRMKDALFERFYDLYEHQIPVGLPPLQNFVHLNVFSDSQGTRIKVEVSSPDVFDYKTGKLIPDEKPNALQIFYDKLGLKT